MRARENFSPIAPDESLWLPIDFATYLASGDSIPSGNVTWKCTVAEDSAVNDPTPTDRLIDTPTIDGTIVMQKISGCVDGVRYILEAVVVTAAGETLSIWSYLECRSPGGQ